jgi:hypothetical protein
VASHEYHKPKSKRSPTSHRTPEQMREHGRTYQAKPRQVANRTKRNEARAVMEKEGLAKPGMDVDHKRMMKSGGTNARSNLRMQSVHKNRGRT